MHAPVQLKETNNMSFNSRTVPGAAAMCLGAVALPVLFWLPPAAAQQLTASQIDPDPPSALTVPARQLSESEREALLQKKLQIRQRMAAIADATAPAAPPGLPAVAGRETRVVDYEAQYPGTPSSLVIGRNNKNTRANVSPSGSTLAEPSAANEGIQVLSAGNYDHAEYSVDGGVNWTNIALPAGPADAPDLCCDNDIVYDQARGVTFLSSLYLNTAGTNGVVRIFVFRSMNAPYACSYTFDQAGTANNILMDFPHLGVSNNFVYLSSNDIPTSGSQNARMRKINADNMADCVSASLSTYSVPSTTYGQRVWRPVKSARGTMYWGHFDNSTTLRIYSWVDSGATSTSVTSTTRTLSATTFGNPDCRGGTGNRDWTDSLWGSITGFNVNGTVGGGRLTFFWNAAADASHTQGHVHGAVFSESGLSLLAQPRIYNSTACFGIPTVAANDRGDLGLSIAYGGKSGGGGAAAQGYVGEDDDSTSGFGVFGTVYKTASGTDNRTDQRYGDYFTVHPHSPCRLFFNATNYALSGGTSTTNVNSRYVEFGRGRDQKCYDRWKSAVPTP